MKKYKNYSELEKFIADNEESELVEYKSNLKDPYRIGQYISAYISSRKLFDYATKLYDSFYEPSEFMEQYGIPDRMYGDVVELFKKIATFYFR